MIKRQVVLASGWLRDYLSHLSGSILSAIELANNPWQQARYAASIEVRWLSAIYALSCCCLVFVSIRR